MADPLQSRILSLLKSEQYRPTKPRGLARELNLNDDHDYHAFRDALRELMQEGRVVLGVAGTVLLPSTQTQRNDEFTGNYRHNKRGFGFVVPTDSTSHEDLYIPEGDNAGAMTGDVVRAKITSRGQRDGKPMHSGRITEILQRTQKRFVGSLAKIRGDWVVMPDGNTLTEPILAPDAASRHIKVGTKVVIEMTQYPSRDQRPAGVITEVLGTAGEKDVDLKSIIIQHNLPGPFPEEVLAQARESLDSFDPEEERATRIDMTDDVVCTIDPDDAKDYDDAISLRRREDTGYWELGVHIADVSHFVPKDSALDLEAAARGNSAYFPGHVIPMLPEMLSNGVCSLQEGVPRLCKSAFITYDEDARPVTAKFANTIIHSRSRLRYREAQAIIDGAAEIPHPDGPKKISDYPSEVVELLGQMNTLAKRLQQRRLAQGQLVLDLPQVELKLDEEGRVVDAVPEDASFTHTLIEMFMVEANEAVARVLDSVDVPFLRRTHPTPEASGSEKLRNFVQIAGFKLPKDLDRKAIQQLLASVKGKPESFAISLAVLKSLTRAEYSPEVIGHYALASEHYCHFTSPIRRYADLTIHRLLDAYFAARNNTGGERGKKRKKFTLDDVPTYDELVEIGKRISFTERRAEDAERELRQVKLLELMQKHIGAEFTGVVTGITNFGIFIQIQPYLVDGLIRYENLMDDWWDVDERSGSIRGQRTGQKIAIGDVCRVLVARVDTARRELDLSVREVIGRGARPDAPTDPQQQGAGGKPGKKPHQRRGGGKLKNPVKKDARGGQGRNQRGRKRGR